MIIKKSMLNTHKKYRGTWPFTVDEVAVTRINIGDEAAFSICHEYKVYAMSGVLEEHGFRPLEESGIWAIDRMKYDRVTRPKDNEWGFEQYRSLSQFFEFCEWQSGRMG